MTKLTHLFETSSRLALRTQAAPDPTGVITRSVYTKGVLYHPYYNKLMKVLHD